MKTRMLWGTYAPDAPPHMNGILTAADGVYWLGKSYRPIGQQSQLFTALSGTFNGCASFVDSAGDVTILAGNTTDLYKWTGSAWSSIRTPAAFGGRWNFTQFGDLAICTNGDEVVKVTLTSGVAAALGGTPPDAFLCATVRDFVLLGRTGGSDHKVTWSAFNNAESWTAGTTLSGFQTMLSGGEIVAITGGEFALILQRYRIVRMSLTGDGAAPFQFDEISTNFGCRAEGSVVKVGNNTYFLSDKGFCVSDGVQVQLLGLDEAGNSQFNDTFLETYDSTAIGGMWGTFDPIRSLVIWCVNGDLWIYNWASGRMTTARLNARAVAPAFTTGLTIDALDAVYTNLDLVTVSLDSATLKGGNPRLLVIGSDGKFNVLEGDPMAANITTEYYEFNEGRTTRLRTIHPITDATSGVTITAGSSHQLGAAETTSSGTTLSAHGNMKVRAQGRYIRLTQAIAAGTNWSYSNGLVVEHSAGGTR